MALIDKLPLEIDALSLLAEGLNFDFAAKGIDEPLTTEELQGMQGMLGIRDGVLKTSGKTNPSARDFITFSGRGQTQDAIVGGPKEIADKLEEMFVEPRLRRLCHRGDLCAGLLCRFRQAHRAGTAAPRAVPQGLCRQDAARESGLAAARRPAPGRPGRRPRPNKKRKQPCAG